MLNVANRRTPLSGAFSSSRVRASGMSIAPTARPDRAARREVDPRSSGNAGAHAVAHHRRASARGGAVHDCACRARTRLRVVELGGTGPSRFGRQGGLHETAACGTAVAAPALLKAPLFGCTRHAGIFPKCDNLHITPNIKNMLRLTRDFKSNQIGLWQYKRQGRPDEHSKIV